MKWGFYASRFLILNRSNKPGSRSFVVGMNALALLKEQVVSNHILPRRLHDESAFDSLERLDLAEGSGVSASKEYSSLYRMKKGVKT